MGLTIKAASAPAFYLLTSPTRPAYLWRCAGSFPRCASSNVSRS